VIVCGIENIDAMGVHTGDSVTVAPILTLTDKEYQVLRDAALAIMRAVGVETGGSNVQFAVNPNPEAGPDGKKKFEFVVVEMNPRVSRSSALARRRRGSRSRRSRRSWRWGTRWTSFATTSRGRRARASSPPSTMWSPRCRGGPSRSSPRRTRR
jgi:carbamoyl-phosphate synthase large subunit